MTRQSPPGGTPNRPPDLKDSAEAAQSPQEGAAAIRAQAFEEAARAAEAGGCDCSFAWCQHDEAGEAIAARIRALAGRSVSDRPPVNPPVASADPELAKLLREARATLEHAQQQIPVRCSIETQVGFSCDVMDEIDATLARIDAALRESSAAEEKP